MFLDHAYGLPFIDWLSKESPWLYMIIVSLAQSVGMYALNYGIFRLIIKIKVEKKQ